MRTHETITHRNTYKAVFRYPAAQNLEWKDVRSMLGAMTDVVYGHNGSLKVSRNGQTLVLHPSPDQEVAAVRELMQIRRFLERSGAASAEPMAAGTHLLVVINHRQARIYKTELKGSVPEQITPYDPGGFNRHLHYVQDDSNGQRKPERKSFYSDVAKALRGAEKILVFGSGTGASSAMEHLLSELKHQHADVARHIIGSIVLDEKHMTENQILAKAREFYAKDAS